MRKFALAAALTTITSGAALADSGCQYIQNGAVLTAGQWNACFAAKQDSLGYTPLNVAGGTMLGPLVTAPPNTTVTGFRLPAGTAPTAPVNGDLWTTTAGLYVRIGGVTIGPLSGATTASFAGTSPIGVTFPAGVVTYAFDFTVANTFLAQQTDQGATTTSPGWYAKIAGDTQARVRVGLNATDVPSIAFGPGNAVRDAFIERVGAGAMRFGAPDAATAVAQTLSVQNVVAGTSNTAGANLTIAGSQGTGTGVGGSILFQVAAAGGSGTAQNALATALTLDSTKLATFGGHLSVEGVTSTGATGTGKFVFDANASMSALTVTSSFTATGLVTLADLATQSANTVLVNATSGAASPTAQSVPSCSGAANALQWTTNTGIGCGTITAAASSVTVGVTTVGSSADTRILRVTGSTLGDYTISGSGTVVAMATAPSFTTPTLGAGLFTSLAGGIIGPQSNSTTALKITKADLSTAVMTFDTTNARVGINKTPGAFDLDVNGAVNIGGALTAASIVGPLATSSVFGAVKVDGTTITASGGIITAVGAAATSVAVGTTTITSGTGNGPLTNNSNVLGNVLWGQLPGIAGNTVASAGNLGEVLSSNVALASAVSLTNGTGADITTLSITAGHWQLSGLICVNGGTSTTISQFFHSITATANTIPTTAPNIANGETLFTMRGINVTLSNGQSATCATTGTSDIYLSGTVTYHLVAQYSFGASTLSAYGTLTARRVQ